MAAGWDWAPISWEAAATFATGFAAVGAAWWVGRRQLGVTGRQAEIAARQSAILERQVELEELNQRIALFDKRSDIYDATERFLVEIMRHAAEPDQEFQRAFLTAAGRARFLFRPQVHDRLQQLWSDACQFFAVKSVMTAEYERTGDYGAGNVDREHKLLSEFNELLSSLPDLFGDELRLGAPLGPAP